jgi:iron(III) transport system permease protein
VSHSPIELDHQRRAFIERWINYARARATSPQFLISIALLAALVYLVLVPLVGLIWRTFTWGEGDHRFSPAAVPGDVTGFHWMEAFSGPSSNALLFEPLSNSLITGLFAAVFALLLGAILAWLVTRTDMPGTGWLRPILLIPYVVPSFAIALAWETLFKSPRIGGTPGLYETVLGFGPPEWLSYGPVPIIITMSIHYFPFAFLLLCGALASLDSQLEECAEIQGASRWTILRKITFPIVAPALAAAAILTFGKTVGTFALPFLLGMPVQYATLATRLFSSLNQGLDALGYILALVLIGITALAVYASSRVLGGNMSRFETIGGKGFKGQLTRLRKWRWPLFGITAIVALVAAVFPILLLGYQTIMLVDGFYGFDNLTLHYWIGESDPELAEGEAGLVRNDVILGATWNTLKLAFISSAICSVVGLIIGYIVVRERDGWMAKLLDQISFAPFLFPAIAFAAMYLSLFAEARGPIPALYGTFTLLVLISVVNRLPYSVRTGTSAVTQIGQELEEAAEIQGASWMQRFRQIVLPLATTGLVAGILVSFVGMMRELSLIILLITPSTRVLMTVGFRYAEEDQVQLGNALILFVTLLTLAGQYLVWRLGKGRLARLRERSI